MDMDNRMGIDFWSGRGGQVRATAGGEEIGTNIIDQKLLNGEKNP